MVIYPGDWTFPHLNLTPTFYPNPQTSISDAETVLLSIRFQCIYQDAGSSGIHVRVSGGGGKITGYSSSYFTAQRYDEQANPISVASSVIEFYRSWSTEEEVYFATVYIKASDIGRMWVYTRGWATDTNDVVHCNYDSSKVNPWETRHHSTSVADDRPSPSIQMPSVEPWIIRQPESWADDRWDGSYKFTWYSCWENYFDVYDDDVTAPSFSYPSTYPSGVVYDSYTSGISSYILCYIDIHDLSGLSEVGFSYRFDTTAWSPWDVGSSDIVGFPEAYG